MTNTILPLGPSSAGVKMTKRDLLMEAARTALEDLLADVVDTEQPAAVMDLLTYDCDFTDRDWRKLAALAEIQAIDITRDDAEDRRVRRAEDGWRDA